METEHLKAKLEAMLTPKRLAHSLNVMETAVKLAERYGGNCEKAAVAGLLHDCARDIRGNRIFELCEKFKIEADEIMKIQPELLHGALGKVLARTEFGIDDEEILSAINYHTTGHENMSLLDKIIFIADYIEPGRDFSGVEDVRSQAFLDLDKSIIMALDGTIKYLLNKGAFVHPAAIEARNFILKTK